MEFQNAYRWGWWCNCCYIFAWGQQFSCSQGISPSKSSSLIRIPDYVIPYLEYWSCIFCQESSVIHSNANLGVHGQGFLNLSGPGDIIESQRLILSLFFSINVSWYLLPMVCKCSFKTRWKSFDACKFEFIFLISLCCWCLTGTLILGKD